jgi:uncharacterized protein YkwD
VSPSPVRAAAFAFAIAVATIALTLPAVEAAASPNATMLKRINAARKHHGLRSVRLSKSISAGSQSYARTLAHNSLFQHALHPSAHGFGSVAEILGLGWGTCRARCVVRAWVRSPTHRAILLGRSYRYVGVGRADGRANGQRARYWVVRFGRG